MLKGAQKDVDRYLGQLLGKINEMPGLRDELLAVRDTLLWLASYPEPAEAL